MFRVECMCGAELEVSEASSSSAMRVNPHECRGWVGWVEKWNEHNPEHPVEVPVAASNTGTKP